MKLRPYKTVLLRKTHSQDLKRSRRGGGDFGENRLLELIFVVHANSSDDCVRSKKSRKYLFFLSKRLAWQKRNERCWAPVTTHSHTLPPDRLAEATAQFASQKNPTCRQGVFVHFNCSPVLQLCPVPKKALSPEQEAVKSNSDRASN